MHHHQQDATKITVVGIRPWLPWPLSRWRFFSEPVRAERLAALRIGLALVLLLDILFTYWPGRHDFFGSDSLGSPHLARYDLQETSWRWSLLKDVKSPAMIQAALAVWIVAAFFLLIGMGTRLSAVVVWALSVSVANINPYIDNAGDLIRGITLFYLMLCPCGAVWSVDAWLKRRLGRQTGPVYVYPWVICLLFLQLVFIYWCNGLYKLAGITWRDGSSLYYVLADPTLTRWSYAQVPVPYWLTRLLTWIVLAWEVTFPLLVCWRPTRIAALIFGVFFHLSIGLTMELGGFAPYALCLYLPLLPWERFATRSEARH